MVLWLKRIYRRASCKYSSVSLFIFLPGYWSFEILAGFLYSFYRFSCTEPAYFSFWVLDLWALRDRGTTVWTGSATAILLAPYLFTAMADASSMRLYHEQGVCFEPRFGYRSNVSYLFHTGHHILIFFIILLCEWLMHIRVWQSSYVHVPCTCTDVWVHKLAYASLFCA